MKECYQCGEEFTWESARFSRSQWMKGVTGRCKTCVQSTGSVGGHTGDGCGGFATSRTDTTGRYADTAGDVGFGAEVQLGRVFAQGAFKNVRSLPHSLAPPLTTQGW
eukprot:CAMPEP_0173417772 /NCGR_PEP_ID=MMETSP1357-20121228/28_1 /TAXON_ID=77926 /ORGANISM="Hemiselmis rufescens, Strain PCC563" /LENGTH=106 /DNA_ID=CAMNT_0014380119 /DNA_START=62 /DNA_END=379 /DNA_ORIENTATION=+